MLEDLRSLCRAAQAFDEQHEEATLTGFLEQGDPLALYQVLDLSSHYWAEALEVEDDKHGIDWEDELTSGPASTSAARRSV